MSRDQMYQEGIVLGDYVVNQFLNSGHVRAILDPRPLDILSRRLKAELHSFRTESLAVLRNALLIEEDDVEAHSPPQQEFIDQPVVSVDRYAVSMPVIEFLKQHSVNQPIVMKKLVIDADSIRSHTSVQDWTTQTFPSSKVGLISGIVTDEIFDVGSPSASMTPPTPSCLRLNVQTLPSFDMFAVLDPQKAEFPKGVRKRRRKTTREVGAGVFGKDGTYYALAYGGFIHACGGALEWPFKTAELEFVDFFDNED
jgi:hypothetical protein